MGRNVCFEVEIRSQKACTHCVIIAELVREKRKEMIKVTDVAYARFRAPDLEKMETFLKDFGLERSGPR